MKRLRTSSKTIKKKSSTIIKYKPKRRMARKRKSVKRRSSKKSSSIFGINTMKALSAGIYGALRMKSSNMLAPYTSKIPLGNISDEAGMLLVSTLGKKYLFKRAGVLRDAMTAGQTIELARIGEAIASGSLGINLLGMGSSQPTDSGYKFN